MWVRKRGALVLAASEGDTATVQELLDKGADVNEKDKDGYTALYLAAMSGHTVTVQVLLDSGANVDERRYGFTALIIAAEFGHNAIVEALLAKGADVNAENDHGWTAFRIAAHQGLTETAALLKQHGARE